MPCSRRSHRSESDSDLGEEGVGSMFWDGGSVYPWVCCGVCREESRVRACVCMRLKLSLQDGVDRAAPSSA